jgi:hypothetical protein
VRLFKATLGGDHIVRGFCNADIRASPFGTPHKASESPPITVALDVPFHGIATADTNSVNIDMYSWRTLAH